MPKICQSSSVLNHLLLLCMWTLLFTDLISFVMFLWAMFDQSIYTFSSRCSSVAGAGSISAIVPSRMSQSCLDIGCMQVKNLTFVVCMELILQHSWVFEWHGLYLINDVSIIIGIGCLILSGLSHSQGLWGQVHTEWVMVTILEMCDCICDALLCRVAIATSFRNGVVHKDACSSSHVNT